MAACEEQQMLPPEVVAHVLSFAASHVALERMRRVCAAWRDLIDHTPALRGLFTVLDVEGSRMPPAALHRIRLVRCPKVLHHPITTLLASSMGATVRRVHIEDCCQIASGHVRLDSIIRNCPQLESLVFLSTNEKKELKTSNSDRMSWATPLMSAFNETKIQLSLFRTNVLIPTTALLRTLGRHCARVEFSTLSHRSTLDNPLLAEALVAFSEIGIGKRIGVLTANVRPRYRAPVRELATGEMFAYNPKRYSLVDEMTLTRYQLLDLNDQGVASLLDSEGQLRDGFELNQHWYDLIEPLFSAGADVSLLTLLLPDGLEIVSDMLVERNSLS